MCLQALGWKGGGAGRFPQPQPQDLQRVVSWQHISRNQGSHQDTKKAKNKIKIHKTFLREDKCMGTGINQFPPHQSSAPARLTSVQTLQGADGVTETPGRDVARPCPSGGSKQKLRFPFLSESSPRALRRFAECNSEICLSLREKQPNQILAFLPHSRGAKLAFR